MEKRGEEMLRDLITRQSGCNIVINRSTGGRMRRRMKAIHQAVLL